MASKLNVETLGQVFTQDDIVDIMIKLSGNTGRVLEPSCGAGAFSSRLENCVAIELDPIVAPNDAIIMDFLKYDSTEKFMRIIGNPPYVKWKDISQDTVNELGALLNNFDERTNLYLFFIWKCLDHLLPGGELIFITPREFLKATSSIKLNQKIFSEGTITDFIDLGDAKVFKGFNPNCVIWRFEKENFSRKTNYSILSYSKGKINQTTPEIKNFVNMNGQLCFVNDEYNVSFKDLFFVKVGAVSGADEIFRNDLGNEDFVYSKTAENGNTIKYFYNQMTDELLPFKDKLLARGIKKFSEKDWFMWGRNNIDLDDNRVYVNCKTRNEKPFFQHKSKMFDGSVLGVFPRNQAINFKELTEDLNNVNWYELGFLCDGRFIFAQKSLENCYLPKKFEKYLPEHKAIVKII